MCGPFKWPCELLGVFRLVGEKKGGMEGGGGGGLEEGLGWVGVLGGRGGGREGMGDGGPNLNEVQRARVAAMDAEGRAKVEAARGMRVFRRLVARYGRAEYWEGRHRRALEGGGGGGAQHEEWYVGGEELGPVMAGGPGAG